MRYIDTLRSVVQLRRFERNTALRRLARVADINDLRDLARRRVPRGVFDYIDGGAEDEITLGWNREAFANVEFIPRGLVDVSRVDTSSTVLGRQVDFPLILAPTGFTRIADPAGELAVARAAQRGKIPYALSTMATRSIEEVASVSDGDLWFQLYVWRDRGFVADLLERSAASNYTTLVITIDTPVHGRRERDERRGFSLPPKIGPRTIVDGALHPAWTTAFLRAEPIRFANVVGRNIADGASAVTLADFVGAQFDPALSWSDLSWVRDRWNGPIVIKGIQSVADARRAVEAGIDAIALSNHGGRQLDGSPPALELVSDARDAIGDGVEIYCDGGIRRGSDIVKAVAYGANAVMAGRPYLYGLAAAGEQGVDHSIELLRSGMERTMALLGRTSVGELDQQVVRKRSTAATLLQAQREF